MIWLYRQYQKYKLYVYYCIIKQIMNKLPTKINSNKTELQLTKFPYIFSGLCNKSAESRVSVEQCNSERTESAEIIGI